MIMNIERLPEFDNHKLVSFFNDKKTGLRGFIAIHNTNLGPAAGATRYWNYLSEEDGLRDALRLSKGMTYKAALAGLNYGGGKSVIIADGKIKKSSAFFKAYAEKINLLNGNFYTGEDVGMNRNDVGVMAKYTPFVIGKLKESNQPPFWTAVGIFSAIEAAVESVFGAKNIKGKTFAVKGLGKVGMELCKIIHKNGGHIIGADVNPKIIKLAKKHFPKIKLVKPSEIHKKKVNIYCPCALGGEFNKKTVSELRCDIICGGANNQLASMEAGKYIYKSGILYIPDYLANAGGLINVVAELDKGGYNRDKVEKKVKTIGAIAEIIIKKSLKNKIPTNEVADSMAESRFMKNEPVKI